MKKFDPSSRAFPKSMFTFLFNWRPRVLSATILVAGIFLFLGLPPVHAAPLIWSTDELISLTSPTTTLDIVAGSMADSLQVNTSSIIITLSASTGGSFTLGVAAPYNLAVTSIGSGGSVSLSCPGGNAAAVLSQGSGSTAYTITPTSPQCVTPTVGVGSSYAAPSGGGGGTISSPPVASSSVSSLPTPATSTTSSALTSSSIASLTAELVSLQAQLAALQKQAGQPAAAPASTPFAFARNLELWASGSDVTNLQLFLTAEAKGPAAARLKANGATRTFGLLTYNALVEFQKSVGIVPASGYFGPKTRAYVSANGQ
jgi:hypothetical protein